MKKQVKIKDVKIGEKFSLYKDVTTEYLKIESTYLDDSKYRMNRVCFGLIVNRVIVINEASLVFIEAPELTFEDLNVGDEFTIYGLKYVKIKSVSQERSESYLALKLDCNTCYLISSHSPVRKID